MIEFATLLLAAAALVMAIAAFRKATATSGKDSEAARDAALRQELSALKSVIDTLPGRIADETAASPLREAMEGVRESITRASETLDEHVIRVGQGFTVSTQAMEASLDRGFKGLATNLESLRMVTENGNKALASSDPAKGFASLEGVLREVLKSADEHADAREKAIEAGLHKIELSLLPVVDSIGRLSGRVDALPEGLETQFARLEMATKGLSGGLTEIVNVSRELAASQASAGGSDEVVKATKEVGQAVLALGQELAKSANASQEAALPVLEGLEALSKDLRASLSALPLQIAEASAVHARPIPELEELAIAVRESGHMRGDAARSVADAVSRVSQELSEAALAGSEARSESAASLREAMERLDTFAGQIESRLAPLADALKGHGDAVGPIAHGLNMAQDRLEEAAASLRANQAEFAASVAVFTQAAQELSGGLSLFAHEGDRQGAEDPRAAQKALLESLDRLMVGFAESLKALLTESDLRTREVLAEIAARLPAGEGA
ncbi:MAG: hypothetical protein RL173_3336 [Fibrobacterota bacterium]|jgi:molecular chaperone GrpE (heat shock protein)